MRRIVVVLALFLSTILGTAATRGAADTPPLNTSAPHTASRAGLQVGSQDLHRCDLGIGRATWCGKLAVPLDPSDPGAASIGIGFGWLPAPGKARGTVVAQEGGPGYPSTGSAADFANMLGPLLVHRNLLVVDARGTGSSSAIDCEPLQSLSPLSVKFAAALRSCGYALNHTYAHRGGGYVHASDLFTTAISAGDLAAVVTALHTGKVDYYGDSYGTYFGQSFLSRYPGLVRSVVLDSAYEARDLDPWYVSTVTTARRAFDEVCARATRCPPGSSWARIGALARLLRTHPVHGTTVDTDGHRVRETVGVTALVNIVNDAGYDTEPYRQLDAAARAYLHHRDGAPLLRLFAQDVGWDYGDYTASADYYSDGLYFAVACTDYPQLFSMHSSRSARVRQLKAAIATLPARTFAPFTTREWLRTLSYTEAFTACLDWPAPTHRSVPPVLVGKPLDPHRIPVLILNGELDSLTPAVGGAHIARQMGPGARTAIASNNVHLVALYDSHGCGSVLVQRFIATPYARLDTSCLTRIPAIRAVPRYPRSVAAALPARGQASLGDRRIASVALGAVGDAVNRAAFLNGSHDLGLRGGSVTYRDSGLTLQRVRWTVDSTVSAVVRTTDDVAQARVTVRTRAGATRRVSLSWGAGRWATLRIGSATLSAPAP